MFRIAMGVLLVVLPILGTIVLRIAVDEPIDGLTWTIVGGALLPFVGAGLGLLTVPERLREAGRTNGFVGSLSLLFGGAAYVGLALGASQLAPFDLGLPLPHLILGALCTLIGLGSIAMTVTRPFEPPSEG